MQIWITFILINIIHQTHVSAAPVDSSFAKIADTIINPAWIKNNPDSPKKNGENIPIDGEIDDSNTKNKKKNNSRRKNKTSGKKRNNNKTRNNRRRNNTGHNGRYLWYSVFTVDELLVNLPEYRNHEDEQKIVLIWDDKRKIVQNEHVDALSMYNLNNNQLIRQKRDNILELQDNILKKKYINQHDWEENENSMSSNSNENIKENMEFLNLRNSNTNKLKNILKNRKQPTNTIRNEISRPSHAQGLGIPLGADISEKEESQLKIIEENPQKINAKTTLSNDKPELIIGENTSIDKNTPEIEKIDTLINEMNSNSNQSADYEQDSKSYPLSIETKNKITNYSYIEENKQHDIIKNIKHQFKPKTRKLEKKQPKNNDEGTLQTRFTLNAPSKNDQKTPSIPEHKIEGNTDIAKNIPTNDEIETLLNALNSNSQENSSSENSDLSTSSLEKQQDILDLSDLGDNKEKNLLKSIKQPSKPISKIEGKTLLENNEKLPEIYEKYLNNPSETNTKNKKGSQQIGNTPSSLSINNQQTPSINVPGHITPEHTDISQNIPSNVEIETLMNAINLNSEEGTDDQNSEPYSSSLEIKQEIPNYSDDENNKQHDILKNIETPFKLKPRKLGKIRPKNNDKGTLQTRFTPNAPSKNYQKTASIDIPEHKTEGTTDISQNIPSNVEIETLMNAINLNSEEGTDDQNSEPYSSSLEIKQEIPNYSDDENNKQHDILKKIETPFKPKTRKLGKIRPKNNDKGTLQTRFTPNAPSKNYQKTASIDIPEQNTEGNTDNAKNIHVNDEIDTLINIMHSNLEEDSIGQNSDSNPSSLDKQQYILDFSDLGDNKGKNLLKSIKQPLKPLSKMQEKKLLENNEKLPGIYKQKFNNSLEINKKDEEGPQQKTLTLITQNLDQDKIKSTPAYDNFKSNIIQKKKSIKTPDLMDTIDQETTNTIEEISIEIPLDDFGDSDGLQDQNNTRGMTMKGAAMGNMKDKSPSSVLNNKNKKDHKDGHQKINQNPNRNIHKTSIKKSKSIKTPDLIDTTVPKSTEKVVELTTETPLNDNDVLNPLGEYNKLGGFTMEDAALEIIKDETPSSTLNYNSMKDHDDSLQVTNQPMLMKPNTVNPNTEHNEDVHINIDEVPKSGFDGNEKKKFVEKFGSNSLADLFGGSLDFNEEDLSEPSINKKKVIPISKPNNVIKNVEDEKLQPIQTNNDNKSNIIQKSKSIKTPDLIDTTVPKSTEKVIELTTETPLNDNDVLNPLGEYNKLGGFTMEDAALEIIKDETPSSTLNYNSKKDNDDNFQKINEPKFIYPITEESYTKYNVGDVTKFKTYTPSTTTNNEEIPKNLSGSHGNIMLDDNINSNPIDNFFGSSISFDKIKLPQPGYKDKDVITKPGNILPNFDDVTLITTLTDDDIKPNSLQKNKFIKKLNPVSNTDSIMFDLIEPTTQINYDILKNDNNLPLSKLPSNVIDKHSSNSNTIHKYNNNLLENDKDVTFNRSLITNPCVEYNSKDLSSLEDDDRYGYMLPKFSTKYSEGGESNYNLWETIPPKKNDDVSSDKGYDNLINDFNQSSDFTTKNNKISSHTLNENSIVTGTESVKNNNYNIDKVNTDIHNKQYDDLIKKMSEQLFKKIDNIDDKLAKLDKVSHNSSYVREIGNIGSHEPTMNNVLLSNGIPISKPEKVINIEDSYSKTTKPSSLEINTSNKSDDENEINKNESPKAKKHKNKKHKRHGNKKKDEKNNTSNDDDGEDDDDDDDDNYDGNRKNNKRHEHKDKHNDDDGKHKKNKRHKNKDLNKDDDKHKKNKRHKNKDLNNDDDGKHKQNKRHKNKDINNDDGGKHKKNKRHKNKDLNDNDNGKHKKNNGHKKNKTIDDDNDNGGHRKKSHKKTYNKVDDDIVSKHKKHKSNKKKDRNYNDVELLQSKITDNKKKKKIKENVYSTEESNDVNYSSSIQINSENSDSVKRLKTTSSKSKISKKTNSTKSKKSPPKKKSKYVKHSKTIKYKNKEIPVDVSDEDTSSNENNYNSEKTYIKYISNNKQNNVPKDKKHKHKKHNKHSKTSKTYIYKKIPGDNDSDENGVNLEETYNINIISDDDALRQKKHRHKKKKNFDINIVKDTDTDTDTQVLNNDKKPQTGYQFYLLSPQYRYATLNPFARLF